jgi:hypothetical protein
MGAYLQFHGYPASCSIRPGSMCPFIFTSVTNSFRVTLKSADWDPFRPGFLETLQADCAEVLRYLTFHGFLGSCGEVASIFECLITILDNPLRC